MKRYLLLLLVMVAGQSYAAGDCKVKLFDGRDRDPTKYTYIGGCENGYAHGRGKYIFNDNKTYYEGDFKNGLENGYGVFVYKGNGSYYRGEWRDGWWNGFGSYYLHKYDYSSGHKIAEGEWQGDYYVSEGVWNRSSLKRKCGQYECGLDYDPYAGLDRETKIDILMSKITTAFKEERYDDALPYFNFLAKYDNDLPESFYFYQIQSLYKARHSDDAKEKAKDYLKKHGSKGKYYAEVIEIMGR